MKIVLGTFREHIAYMSKELITELRRVNLLVYIIRDEIPDNLLSSLETKGIRSATDGPVVPKGKPRYVKGRISTLHPNTLARY
jgi:hypothetical protein